MRRVLFGPVSADFAARYLARPRAAGECLAFGPGPGVDAAVGPGDAWADLAARLPDGWAPDVLAAWLPYARVPPAVWGCPAPVVALAPDWTLLWHAYRHLLPPCDLVLTDRPGVEALARAGVAHARPANLFGLGDDFLADIDAPDGGRDLDVVFVGNLHPAVQRARLPWAGRVAALAARHRVVVASGVFGADYRALLRRARLAFNLGARGECNQRALEAPACGALLLQEAGNAEVPEYLAPWEEYAPYTDRDFEAVVARLLADDALRSGVAAAGRGRVRGYGFWPLLAAALGRLAPEWDGVSSRAAARSAGRVVVPAAGEAWAALGSDRPGDAELAARAAADGDWHAAALVTPDLGEAGGALARAAPSSRASRLARAEWLAAQGRPDEAAAEARALLDALAAGRPLTPAERDAPPWPGRFDLARVEWERAAALHPGDPAAEAAAKADVLRLRAHALLADLTGDLAHYHGAALARPDLPAPRAALGCALARAGRPAGAAPHLRAAVAGNPLDRAAARALYQCLADLGEWPAARALARDRRALHAGAPGVVPAEDWFAGGGPVGDELASVVVPCHNELAYTRLCLESVLRHARPPFELVLVDNGSTDGTPEYLAGLAGRAGPERVEVVRSEANLGYAAGVNRGLAAARGEWLVLLNNDVVATPGWLDGLLAAAVAGDRAAGLVGPVTNYAPPPQLAAAGYADLDGLDAFADAHARRHRGAVAAVERLTGFCLVAWRGLLDAVGRLDEGYGVGFFEDDDLCVRARRAGFPLRLAGGVYVHHFGSRTFAALGVDTDARLRENHARFRAKWGDAEADRYAAPDPGDAPAPAPAVPRGRMRVALTMIVRDEAHNLPACLGGVRGLFDDVAVVDTGSSDGTPEVAAALGARVSRFPWVDDFAAARNAALDAARGDYAFWLDADDRLDGPNRDRLAALLASLADEHAAYVVKCRCVPDRPGASATVVDHVRLFRLRPDVRWAYRVHEQILPALRRTGADVRWSDVTVDHVGYVDPALRGRKLDRDLRLLRMELAADPGEPFVLFNLASAYQELGRHDEALDAAARSLAASHPSDSIVRKLYALAAQCHRRLGRRDEARRSVADGRALYPADAELLFLEGVLRRDAGDLPGAARSFRELVGGTDGEHFGSVDAGLRGPKARHNLAVVYLDQGMAAEAGAQWRHALVEEPDFLPARVGLGELALRAGDWPGVDRAAAGLEDRGAEGEAEGAALRARARIARGEFAAARAVLGAARVRHPRAVALAVLESHAWLKEGADDDAAERALRAVLDLDPSHAEAKSNLEVLLRRRGRWVEGVGGG